MKYKLVDVRNEVEEDVTFGTCELCMSVGSNHYEVYYVEDEDGHKYQFESGFWSWGDYYDYTYESIQNVIEFASWFSKRELPKDLTENQFWDEVSLYIEEFQGGE